MGEADTPPRNTAGGGLTSVRSGRTAHHHAVPVEHEGAPLSISGKLVVFRATLIARRAARLNTQRYRRRRAMDRTFRREPVGATAVAEHTTQMHRLAIYA